MGSVEPSEGSIRRGKPTEAAETVSPPLGSGILAPGSLIGSYRIERELGRGGMAVVYEAYDVRLARSAAMKVMSRELSESAEAVQRFLREARLLAGLAHPHLVCVYEAGSSPAGPYLVMELLKGETLAAQLTRTGRLAPADARRHVHQIAEALAAVHARGMIHRDVKPANIMILPERGAVLTDFGLARPAASGMSLTMPGYVFGTPEYMSPEQARGDPLDARADLYALGTVWFELVAGRTPFSGSSVAAILRDQVQTPLPPIPAEAHLSRAEEEILQRCLAKRREERFPDAQTLAAAIARLDKKEKSGARSSTTPAAAPSRRVTLAVGILAALLVFAVGTWLARVRGGRSAKGSKEGSARELSQGRAEAPSTAHDGVLDPARVSDWLAEPNFEKFLQSFTPGPLGSAEVRRVEEDLTRLADQIRRVENGPKVLPLRRQRFLAQLYLQTARDHCLLGDPQKAHAAIARARQVLPAEVQERLVGAQAALDELFHREPGVR